MAFTPNSKFCFMQKDSSEIAGTHRLEHDGSLATTILNVNYTMSDALAELIDNSIDADARNVLVRLVRTRGRATGLYVVDDGNGIDEGRLDHAMTFARKRDYEDEAIGMYGVGLKSASLNMANQLDVISKAKSSRASGLRWTRAGAERQIVTELKSEWCGGLLKSFWRTLPWNLSGDGDIELLSGTIVSWSSIEEFETHTASQSNDSKFVDTLMDNLANSLSLTFHRLLARRERGIKIFMDIQDLETTETFGLRALTPLDPFGYPQSGHPDYPKDLLLKGDDLQRLKIRLHIWPKGMRTTNFMIPRASGTAAAPLQGLYVYRNDRLLMAGTWADLDTPEAHKILARAEIDLPKGHVPGVRINFHKTEVTFQPSIAKAIHAARTTDGKSFRDWVSDAQVVNRMKAETTSAKMTLPLPTRLIPASVRRTIEDSGGETREIEVEWSQLPMGKVYAIHGNTVVINEAYRDLFKSGESSGIRGYSMSLTLLLLAIRDVLGVKSTSNVKAKAEVLERIINAAAMETK